VVGWIQASRGDDKTYASESRAVRLPAGGDNPVATAASSGKEVALEDPGASSTFKRAGLAKEFNVATLRCVPCAGGGVLEYGIPRQQALPKPAPAPVSSPADASDKVAILPVIKPVSVETPAPALSPAPLVESKPSACCRVS
jgi:hypothetical protein